MYFRVIILLCIWLGLGFLGGFGQTPKSAPTAEPDSKNLPNKAVDSKPSALSAQSPRLVVGKPVERELKGGESHTYTVKLKATDFLNVVIEQKGIDVVVTLFASDGTKLIEVDSPNGTQGPEPVFYIAEKTGDYRLEVKSLDKEPPPGKYEARIVELRKSTKADSLRITAQKAFNEGTQLQNQGGEVSSRKAIEEFQQSLVFWATLGDKQRQAQTLQTIGSVYSELGEKQKALEYYAQALLPFQAVGNRREEAATLNNIGLAYSELGEQQKALEYLAQALPLWQADGDRRGEAGTLTNIGSVYSHLGENQKALEYYAQALPLLRAATDRDREATTLSNIGKVYSDLGEQQKALEYYAQALPLFRAVGDRSGEATTLTNIGTVYSELGENQKALKYFSQALPLWQADGDRSGEATTLTNIGKVYSHLGEKQKALEYYTQALPLKRAMGDRSGEATALHNIGRVYSDLGEQQKALEYYAQALPLLRAVGNRRGESATLNSIGKVYSELGEQQKALEYYAQALLLRQAMGDRSGESATLNSIGKVYSELGEQQKALEYYAQALSLSRAVGDRSGEAPTLNNIGTVYSVLGEKQKALEYYAQVLPLSRAVGDRRGEATTLNNIGGVYSDLGEQQKALEYYAQALSLSRAVGDRSGEALTLNNIGTVYGALGEPQKALGYLMQSLPLFRAVGDRSREALTLNNIGFVYGVLGEPQKALEFYAQALLLRRAVGDRSGEAVTLNNIGVVYSNLGEQQKALEYFAQASPLLRAVGDRSGEANSLTNLMVIWEFLKKPQLAIFYGKQSVNLKQELRADIKGLDKEIQRTFLKTQENTYRRLADLLISEGRLPEAQQVLGLLKEDEYFDFVRRDKADTDSLQARADLTPQETEALKKYTEISDQITSIGSRFLPLDTKRKKLGLEGKLPDAEEAEYQKLKGDLDAANRTFQVVLRQIAEDFDKKFDKPVKKEVEANRALQADLKKWGEGTVSLYTIVGEDKYQVIVTTPNVQVARSYAIKAADLNRKVLVFREAIQNPTVDPRPLAQELYDIIIKPIEKDLDGAKAKTLIWSLDGTLRYLPLAALYDPGKKQYLAERFCNVVITLASRTRLGEPVTTDWRGLGLGVSKAVGGFNPLDSVPAELRSIIHEETAPPANSTDETGVLPGRRLLDEKFTQDALERLLGNGFHVVHIASHFSFRPGNETDSFLLLGDGAKLTLDKIRNAPELAFDNVELLTLSACDTATGGAGADGREIEGFGVLAQERGAKAVLATLWPVADQSTSMLMQHFYRIHQANPKLTKAEALRQAQLALLQGKNLESKPKEDKRGTIVVGEDGTSLPKFTPDPKAPFAHPYYWAPFILIGNWR